MTQDARQRNSVNHADYPGHKGCDYQDRPLY